MLAYGLDVWMSQAFFFIVLFFSGLFLTFFIITCVGIWLDNVPLIIKTGLRLFPVVRKPILQPFVPSSFLPSFCPLLIASSEQMPFIRISLNGSVQSVTWSSGPCLKGQKQEGTNRRRKSKKKVEFLPRAIWNHDILFHVGQISLFSF